MTAGSNVQRYRFGIFELDAKAGELRRKGLRIKLHSQPIQLLVLLLDHPGELLTRQEICQELWPEGTFVDYEHGVNSAVNRLREALGDKAGSPRFVETVARRGYRFIAPVERINTQDQRSQIAPEPIAAPERIAVLAAPSPAGLLDGLLSAPEDLPRTSPRIVLTLFVLLQIMYLGFYVGALANLAEINELFLSLALGSWAFPTLIVTAAILIPVRTFLLCAVLFRAPDVRSKFLKIWPALLASDALWSLAPFLLLHHINYGLALSCVAPLVYSPFAQRSLILMGAGEINSEFSVRHDPSN